MRRCTATVIGLVLVFVVASDPSAAYRGHKVYVATNANAADARYRPHHFWLSGDPTLLATKVKWTRYGGKVAKARGIGHANNCSPSCANGHFKKGKIRLRLSGPKKVCGRYVYSRVRITWVHKPPYGGRKSFRLDPHMGC